MPEKKFGYSFCKYKPLPIDIEKQPMQDDILN
jgi:hypothetical protein